MNLTLTQFESTDKLTLPAMLFEPDDSPDISPQNKKAAIWLHGNGSASAFYSVEAMNTYGKIFTDNDISFFTFNNRGAHILKSLKRNKGTEEQERTMYGCAFELIKDCVQDIDGAINYLKSLGYEEFYLLGASTGANKICVYDHYKNPEENLISAYVLLGPGDDSGIYYDMFGPEKFHAVLKKCKEKVAEGKGREFVSQDIIDSLPKGAIEVYSYQSLLDVIDPDGDYNNFPFKDYFDELNLSQPQGGRHAKELFLEFKNLSKPTLTIFGENDEYLYKSAEESNQVLEGLVQGSENEKQFEFKVIEGADHGFHGKEEEQIEMIIDFIKRHS